MNPAVLSLAHQPGATPGARVLVAVAGVALAVWTLSMLRSRSLLVSLGSIFLSVSGGLVVFAVSPSVFNQLSYAVGVYYPPLLYLILAVLVLMMLNVHLAARLSALDMRFRRIVQDVALHRALEGSNKED